MTNRGKALWAVAAVITLLVVAAINIPNLLRSRIRVSLQRPTVLSLMSPGQPSLCGEKSSRLSYSTAICRH
jgi:hypothetical protein